MKVRWTGPAEADLDRIVVYIAQDSVPAALRLQDHIIESVQLLERHPRRGRRGSVSGTFELVISKSPYVAVYRIADVVEVLRVRHGRQQWPPPSPKPVRH